MTSSQTPCGIPNVAAGRARLSTEAQARPTFRNQPPRKFAERDRTAQAGLVNFHSQTTTQKAVQDHA